MTISLAPEAPITDEHSVLLWQTCAYADDLGDVARSGRRLTSTHDKLLEFLHYRLLPYLSSEERRLPADQFRDHHLLGLLVADHERLRADVENIESSRTRRLLVLAAATLVDRLDRHVRREESWLTEAVGDPSQAVPRDWALPLLFGDVIDLDALPAEHREALIHQRLDWLRPGESVRLRARSDLHPVWRRQHARDHNAHSWIYEEDGPTRWQAQVTRRVTNDC